MSTPPRPPHQPRRPDPRTTAAPGRRPVPRSAAAPPVSDELELAPLEPAPPRPVRLAPVVEDETPCNRCGYLLRGLHEDGRCPECGTPVVESISDGGLELCDWHWLEKVGHGILFILLATVLEPVGYFIGFSHHNLLLGNILWCSAAALDVVGIVLMTQPDPRTQVTGEHAAERLLLRVIALVAFTGGLLAVAGQGLHNRNLVLAGAALMLADVVRSFLYYRLLRVYARQAQDAELAVHCAILTWGLPSAQLLTRGPALLAAALKMVAFGLLACVGILPLVVFGVWSFVINIRFLDTFSAGARDARKHAGIPVWP